MARSMQMAIDRKEINMRLRLNMKLLCKLTRYYFYRIYETLTSFFLYCVRYLKTQINRGERKMSMDECSLLTI